MANINHKAIEEISELIKVGMDGAMNEARSCKKLIETLSDEFNKFREAKDALKAEVKKEMENNCKMIETKVSAFIDSTEIKIATLHDRLKSASADIEDFRKEVEAIPKYDPKVFTDAISNNSERINELKAECKKLGTGFKQIDCSLEPLSMQLEVAQESIAKLQEYSRTIESRMSSIEPQPQPHIVQTVVPDMKLQVKKHMDSVWEYVQKFADLHAVDRCHEVKNPLSDYTTKLNCLQWLLRYYKFLSEKAAMSVIDAFKEIISSANSEERGAYTIVKHNSDTILVTFNCIATLVKGNTLEEAKLVLPDIRIYMGVLEICLINNQNLEIGLSLGIVKELIRHIVLFKSLYDLGESIEELQVTIRCLTYCFRSAMAIDLLLETDIGVNLVFDFMQRANSEEITANTTKILRVCLKSDKNYSKLLHKLPLLFSTLLQLLTTHEYSPIVLEEATGALKDYTRKPSSLLAISEPRVLEPLCELAVSASPSKYKDFSILTLRNCCRNENMLNYIKQKPAYKVVIQTEGEEGPTF
eukprot:TRINITY_DN14140_c0_g1_i3.p1 TRINITY_DN14140_c0_g1~~TRINITY_DN14140_c0_g1_i3.p1  ORF type:complete len:529 (-),score=124.36 TRINITY_DN14140_c0_g1_i3:63-1649(-)